MDLFTPLLRERECKYLIHNNNGFIHPPFQRRGSVNMQFTIIIDLFTPRLRGRKYKYSIQDDNRLIHPPSVREGVLIFNL